MRELILFTALIMLSNSFANAEARIKGSISTSGVKGSDYSSVAKVPLTEAIAKAIAVSPGRVTEAILESEDGYLVYSVEILTGSHVKAEVLVDAGTGAILSTELDD